MAVTRAGFEQWMEKVRQRADARIRARAIQEGKAEGMVVGAAKGKATSVLAVLEARQIPVPAKLRAQMLPCTDDGLLDQWIRRAVNATSAREVLAVTN